MKLRIGTATTPPPTLPDSTPWLARDLGVYQQEGLDVEITEVQATPSVIAAIRSGEVDVGNIQLARTHAWTTLKHARYTEASTGARSLSGASSFRVEALIDNRAGSGTLSVSLPLSPLRVS